MADVFKSFKYEAFSFLILVGTSFVFNVLLVRLISVEEFGVYSLLISWISILILLSSFGVRRGIRFFLADNISSGKRLKKFFGTAFSIILASTFIVGGLFLLFSGYLFSIYKLSASLIPITALLFVLNSLFYFVEPAIIGLNKFVVRGVSKIIWSLSRFSAILLVLLGFSTLGALIGESIAALIFVVFNLVFLRSVFNISFDKKTFSKIFSYSSKIIPSELLQLLVSNFPIVLLGVYSILEVGFLNAFIKFLLPITFLTVVINTIFYPVFVKLKDNKGKLVFYVESLLRYTIIFNAFICVVCFVFSFSIINIFYGREYASRSYLFNVFVLVTFIEMIFVMFHTLLETLNQPGRASVVYFFKVVILVVVSLILVPRYHTLGAIVSYFFAHTIGGLAYFFTVKRILDFKFPIKTFLITVSAALMCFIGLSFIRELFDFYASLVGLCLFSAFYFLTLFVTGELKKDDFSVIKRLF
jgi:O-antigen/teichoic acid export membrane protein